MPTLLRVGTFNIRNPTPQTGPNAWPSRRDAFVRTVRRFDPDVIGFQEVMEVQQADLSAAFADYGSVAVHRDDGRQAGEAAAIFYCRSRFDLSSSGAFWLSETPHQPGLGWDAVCTRICTWATLYDRVAAQDLTVFNTHFDHEGSAARVHSARLIADRMATAASPFLLLGDFNSTEDGPEFAALTAAARAAGRPLTDAFRATNPARRPDREGTIHDFTGRTDGPRIDWILHDRGLAAVESHIDHPAASDGGYPSDHAPVWAVLQYAAR